jgi:protein-tyrosine kinase
MSKLLKALDKARHKKEEGTGAAEELPVRDKLVQAYEKATSSFSGVGTFTSARPIKKVSKDEEIKPRYVKTQVLTANDRVLESNRIMTHLKDPRVKDYYDILRTQVLQRTRANGWNSLMVTSVYPGEGKTLTAINLALAISRQVQQTAILVGANFRSPKVCTYLGFEENRIGLSDYLSNGSQIQDLLFNPGMDKMVILPTGAKMATTDALGSPKMKNLVQELKTRYSDRYVIYDCPHVLDMPDTLIFSSYVDAVLMVVEAGKTPKQRIQEALRTLEEHGVNVIGMVLNRAHSSKVI